MNGLLLKHFVLTPNSSDKEFASASRKAMLVFAYEIFASCPELAMDLREWVAQAESQS